MKQPPPPLDLKKVKVYPLAQRLSLSSVDKILVDPAEAPAPCPADIDSAIRK